MDPIAAIFSALSADINFAVQLATYEGEPAIFSGDTLPANFVVGAAPCALIRPPHAEPENRDTFPDGGAPGSNLGRSVELDVLIFSTSAESAAVIDDAANAARDALHRQYLAGASGEGSALCTVTGPLGTPTSEASIAGRRLAARLDLRG